MTKNVNDEEREKEKAAKAAQADGEAKEDAI
jgi:hypothetical protein